MIRTCGCPPPTQEQRDLASNMLMVEPTSSETLSVPVVYHVLWKTAAQNVSLNRIRDNHLELNLCFTARNEDIDRVPSTGKYGFGASMVGNPNMVFLPQDENEIQESDIRRVETSFDNVSIDSASSNYVGDISPLVAGSLNVYIGNTSGFLGVAQLMSNITLVLFSTVGGQTFKGTLNNYDLGRTLVHEAGHCFGLEHPWETDNCSTQLYDLPLQKNPNYIASLDNNGQNGNHDLDLQGSPCPISGTNTSDCKASGNPNPSCCSCTGKSPTGHFEFFFSYMDYCTDVNLVTFSQGQAAHMYSFLSSSAGRSIFDVMMPELSTPVPVEETEDIFTTPSQGGDDDGFNLLWLILIIPVAIGIAGLIAWGIIVAVR